MLKRLNWEETVTLRDSRALCLENELDFVQVGEAEKRGWEGERGRVGGAVLEIWRGCLVRNFS